MAKFIFCGKCGGLKRVEPEPYDLVSTGNYTWSAHWCDCPAERVAEEAEAKFCPYCGAFIGAEQDRP